MRSNAQKFIDCLDDAVQILDDYPPMQFPETDSRLKLTHTEQFNLALFEQWSELCAPEIQQIPPIRVIQHLSCTGGTLISKCLSAMPNTLLLSEVNPLTTMVNVHRSAFAPTDLIYLTKQADFPQVGELSQKVFRASIDVIFEHARQFGNRLILREHSHSDYHENSASENVRNIRTLLENDHALLSIVTVRHPLDSYLAMVNQGWINFIPATFDEYCRRYLLFVKDNKGLPVFKYETFVDDPQDQMKQMCEALALPFNEDFQDIFDLFSLSGDSGRTSTKIGRRPRRKFDQRLSDEIKESTMYVELCEQLNYEPELADPSQTDCRQTDIPE